ncbi:MAG: hypothetical protein KME35_14180 [Aphanocapsa sp. GSE-SYN-MK-11-07L]|jgi:hypothetical protein|nr:hypothetical protein [Aphanocapsa sp. GSE-SYN-MK-11-07L]
MKKALLAGSLILLAAGGGLQTLTRSVFAEPAAVTQATDVKPAVSPVELLDPGVEPRQALRFKPVLQTKQLSTMSMSMDMSMKSDQANAPMPNTKLPGIVIKIETTVSQIDPNGDIHYQFRYTDINLTEDAKQPPAAAEAMRSQFAKIKDLTGVIVVDSRGQTKSAKFNVPDSMDSMTRQMLDQMSDSINQISVAMPEPAVGVGAKWRVASDVSVFGMKLPQAATYEVVKLQNGAAMLKVGLEQQMTNQTMNLPGLPAASSLEIKSLNTTGQGQMTLSFDRMMPTSAQLAIQSQAEMAITISKTEPPMVMNTDTKLDMTLTSE